MNAPATILSSADATGSAMPASRAKWERWCLIQGGSSPVLIDTELDDARRPAIQPSGETITGFFHRLD